MPPWKQRAWPKSRFQAGQLHARANPLHRIEDIDAHRHQLGQEGTDGAVVVVEDFDAEAVAQVDEALHMRLVKLAKRLQADERPGLAAQIIRHLRDVDQPPHVSNMRR